MAKEVILPEQIVTTKCMGPTMKRFYEEIVESLIAGVVKVKQHGGTTYRFFLQNNEVVIEKTSGGFMTPYVVLT